MRTLISTAFAAVVALVGIFAATQPSAAHYVYPRFYGMYQAPVIVGVPGAAMVGSAFVYSRHGGYYPYYYGGQTYHYVGPNYYHSRPAYLYEGAGYYRPRARRHAASWCARHHAHHGRHH